MIVPSAFARQAQMAIETGQPAPCAPVGLYGSGGVFTKCCPGLVQASDPSGFMHCMNPGSVTGNFVSGPLPVTTGTSGCGGSPGWVVGKQRDCGDDGVGHHHWAAYYVDSSNPKTSLCPAVGDLNYALWVDDQNQPGFSTGEGGIGNRIRLQCIYTDITNPFSQDTLNTFTGVGATRIDVIGGPQNKACDLLKYSQLISDSNCPAFYNTKTANYDYQLVFRINEEHSDGSWVSDSQLLQVVQQVAMGIQASGVTSTSSQGQSLAQSMITNYCIVQNPTGWADNDTLRSLINNWVLNPTGNPQFNSIQKSAQDIVTHYCSSVSPTSSHCDCYNATQFGANIFNACQGNTSNACTDINKLAASMAQAPPTFSAQIATLKSYITPKCAVGQCVSAATGGNTTFLSPTTLAELKCDSNISLCLESVKIGGSLAPGATINQKCTQSMGLPGNTSNQGFQNAQVVQAGGNLVSTLFGGSSNTTTTSTPSGTIRQQVSGPTPGLPTVAIPQDQQVAAAGAGAGLLGLSSSSLFFCCCVIIVILLLSMNKKQPAPRPFVVPGGF